MNEILVEEENTVYELDPECSKAQRRTKTLEEKRKQEKQENDNYRMQEETRKKESEQYVDHMFAVTGDLPIKKRMPNQKASSFIRNH